MVVQIKNTYQNLKRLANELRIDQEGFYWEGLYMAIRWVADHFELWDALAMVHCFLTAIEGNDF
jgi:hypothetical protein